MAKHTGELVRVVPKVKRVVIVKNAEELGRLVTDHAHTEALLDSWFGK